jgi:hypothetical protein
MANLALIVRATVNSASALQCAQHWHRQWQDMRRNPHGLFTTRENIARAERNYRSSMTRYRRAQAVLAANPLPGDRT